MILGILTCVAMIVLRCNLVGIIALPTLIWGLYQHCLEVLDGEPDWRIALSGVGVVPAVMVQMGALASA